MFNPFKKREITEREKTEIIVEFLERELLVYQDMRNTDMDPLRALDLSLDYQKRKLAKMDKRAAVA